MNPNDGVVVGLEEEASDDDDYDEVEGLATPKDAFFANPMAIEPTIDTSPSLSMNASPLPIFLSLLHLLLSVMHPKRVKMCKLIQVFRI